MAKAMSYPQASLYVGDLRPGVVESQLFEKFSAIGPVLSIRICRDAITKNSLGYGYINYSKPADAERALEELNFDCVAGQPMRLMWSHRDPTIRRSGDGNIFIKNLDKDVDNRALFDTFSSFGRILSAKEAGAQLTDRGAAHDDREQGDGDVGEEKESLSDEPRPRPKDPTICRSGDGNIFAKNLDKDVDNRALFGTFSSFGRILSAKVALNEDGSSKGFGFVHFETAEAAKEAIAKVNGKLINGKPVYVGPFKSRSARAAELGDAYPKFTNVYVKNLGSEMTEEKLKELVAEFGEIVSVFVPTDQESKKSRGFGFIAFKGSDAAHKAVEVLNGKEYPEESGIKLYAGRAMKKEERQAEIRRRQEARRRQVASQRSHNANVYLKNLEDSLTEERLKEEFSKYGNITSVKIMSDEKGTSRGFGFVAFSNADDAAKAVSEMNGRILASKPLYVAIAQRKEERRIQLTNAFNQFRGGNKNQAPQQHYGGGMTVAPQYYPMSNTGYSSTPTFVANARANVGPSGMSFGGGRWNVSGGGYGQRYNSASGYPSYGPPHGGRGPNRGSSNQPTATRLLQNSSGAGGYDSRWSGGGPPTLASNGSYPVQYHAGARNRPVENAYSGKSDTMSHTHQPSPSEDKQVLGEQLYPLVAEMVEEGVAGKVTGMLLEIPNEEIVKLLHQPKNLQAKVHEACAVLQESGIKA